MTKKRLVSNADQSFFYLMNMPINQEILPFYFITNTIA